MSDLPCPGCGTTLGQSGPAELRAGTLVLRHVVTLYCGVCGRRYVWRPLTGDRLPPRNLPRKPPEN